MGAVEITISPLKIPEIRWCICSNLSVCELLNARLINNDFNYIASKQLSRANQEVKRFRNSAKLTSFIEVMRNRIQEQLIYTRYKINPKEISDELVIEFCSNIGPQVTLLTLQEYSYSRSVQKRRAKQNKRILVQLLASTRQLKHLTVWTYLEIKLTPEEQNSLAHLSVQTLSVQFDNRFNRNGQRMESSQPDGLSLVLFLARNSISLKEVIVPTIKRSMIQSLGTSEIPDMYLLDKIKVSVGSRSIYYTLPNAFLESNTLAVFQQLDQLGLRFRSMCVHARSDTSELVEFLTQWIQRQENYLEELNIQFHGGQVMGQLQFPAMNVLKKLSITFSYVGGPAPPFAPLGEGQFPILQILTLKWGDGYGGFVFPLPELTHLEFDNSYFGHHPNFTSEWHRLLPKLKSLIFKTHVLDQNVAAKLSYILTNFHYLQDLELQIERNRGDLDEEQADFWNILTGNAPRIGLEEFLDLKSHGNSYHAQQGGISPLANFKRLRKLTFAVGNWTNLEAILFLTATGAIKPLEILQITGRSMDIKDPGAYKSLLTQFHRVVKISVE